LAWLTMHSFLGGNYARSSQSGLNQDFQDFYDEMGDLTEICHAVEMGDLAVGGYEDGGALPLCDVALSQTWQNNRQLVRRWKLCAQQLGV
jgi:hypothetical protein